MNEAKPFKSEMPIKMHVSHLLYMAINQEMLNLGHRTYISRVELPIIEHFPIFSLFFKHIKQFLCQCEHKLKGYKCFLNIENKGTTPKTHEEDE
jgi:hypothetical protein